MRAGRNSWMGGAHTTWGALRASMVCVKCVASTFHIMQLLACWARCLLRAYVHVRVAKNDHDKPYSKPHALNWESCHFTAAAAVAAAAAAVTFYLFSILTYL
jgi:hypothetical protein